MTLVHMVFSHEVFSCAFCTKNPELYGGAAGLSEPVKEKTGQTFFPICLVFFFC